MAMPMESLTSSIVITGHECSTSRVSRVRSVMGYLPLDMHVHGAVRPTLHTPHDRLLLALCLAHVARRVLSDAFTLIMARTSKKYIKERLV